MKGVCFYISFLILIYVSCLLFISFYFVISFCVSYFVPSFYLIYRISLFLSLISQSDFPSELSLILSTHYAFGFTEEASQDDILPAQREIRGGRKGGAAIAWVSELSAGCRLFLTGFHVT